MRKRILKILECPNTHRNSLEIFATELKRGNSISYNVVESEMMEDDDVISGVIVNRNGGYAYPIFKSVALLLSDIDTDREFYVELLQFLRSSCPASFAICIDSTISSLKTTESNWRGEWNREEMHFFDKDVQSEELRKSFLRKIKLDPLWNLYISRSRNITQKINLPFIINKYILEVGSGNSRTVSWIFHPALYHFHYIGSDISFKRLLLAKQVVPEGDYIQCSALNLPFKADTFAAILGFGVFHHLPDPIEAIDNCAAKIKLDGYLAFHEPIQKPKLLSNSNFIKKLLNRYDHSKHDNEINPNDTMSELIKLNFKTIYKKYENSLFRQLAQYLIERIPKAQKQRWIFEIIMLLDEIFLVALCRISKRFGPSAILLVAKK